MTEDLFIEEQRKAIKALSEALKKCQASEIHIANITDYKIFETADAEGKPFISLF
ncbi:MAG: hypothetical protein KIT80_14945 [Chitinophagaceae bacterium]|nr:hypothetical protein [Chitinophagaceae bacterium]MCW5928210.1 hypothetical protein [Chitinophagaceae bacterium]